MNKNTRLGSRVTYGDGVQQYSSKVPSKERSPYTFAACIWAVGQESKSQLKIIVVAQGQLQAAEVAPRHQYSPNYRLIFHPQCEKFLWQSCGSFYP
jgi:hypothetical protein